MPSLFSTLLLLTRIKDAFKDLSALHRRNDTNLVVFTPMFTTSIHDWMDMQLRAGWFSRELAEALDQFLLEVIVQAVLRAEEDNAAL